MTALADALVAAPSGIFLVDGWLLFVVLCIAIGMVIGCLFWR